jgi:hypothetical protein
MTKRNEHVSSGRGHITKLQLSSPKRLIENFSNNHGDVDDVYNGNIVHIRLKRRLMIILFYFPKICKKEKLLIITTKKNS